MLSALEAKDAPISVTSPMTSASTTLYDVTDDVSDYVDDFDVLNFYSINDVDVAFASPSHIV